MTDWVILRCSGSSTLPLAKSLAEAGYGVWTPAEVVSKERTRLGVTKVVKVTEPAIKGWVFAKAEHLGALLDMIHSPSLLHRTWDAEQRRFVVKGHPYFDLLRTNTDLPAMVADHELNALRLHERKRKPRGKAKAFKPGDEVKMTDGAFSGLYGTVQSAKGKMVEVLLTDWKQTVECRAYLLTPLIDEHAKVNVSTNQSEQGHQFRNAA